MLNARVAFGAFGDSFDDADTDNLLFSDDPSDDRWAMVDNPLATCDTEIKTVSGTRDRVIEAKLTGTSSGTLAAWEPSYDPGGGVQTVLIRITTTDGSDFESKTGRIGVGLIGDTGQSGETCSATSEPYTEISEGGSVMAGLDLSDRKPFIFFDSPYTETEYTAISTSELDGVTELSIAVGFGASDVFLSISNSATGEEIFLEEEISYPGNWTFTGDDKGAVIYYGTSGDTGTHIKGFLAVE